MACCSLWEERLAPIWADRINFAISVYSIGYMPGRRPADNSYEKIKRGTGSSTFEVWAYCTNRLPFWSFPSTASFPSRKKFVVAVVDF